MQHDHAAPTAQYSNGATAPAINKLLPYHLAIYLNLKLFGRWPGLLQSAESLPHNFMMPQLMMPISITANPFVPAHTGKFPRKTDRYAKQYGTPLGHQMAETLVRTNSSVHNLNCFDRMTEFVDMHPLSTTTRQNF